MLIQDEENEYEDSENVTSSNHGSSFRLPEGLIPSPYEDQMSTYEKRSAHIPIWLREEPVQEGRQMDYLPRTGRN